jgi:LysR family hydrogen peroxide-inducible transcriptional activator
MQNRDPLKGTLRLGVIYSIGPYLLPHIIPALHRDAPEMPLILQENYTADLVEMLKRGEVDLIIVASDVSEPGLAMQPVYDEPFIVALPKGHHWEKRKSIKPEELIGESMLLLGAGHCFRDQVLKLCPALNRSAGSTGGLQQTLITTSLETIRHMVASGTGITVLPITSVQPKNELLSLVPFTKPIPDRRVCLVWRASFTRLPAVEAVRKAILAAKLPGVNKLDAVATPA